jgi:septation ring formation regulator EzrA
MSDEQEMPDDLPAEAILRWIAKDMKLIRQTLIRISSYIREAESEVPEKMRRYMNYMHDVHDVKYMYEELGHPVPEHLRKELERLDDRYRQLLKELHLDNGAFEKIRREMADDPENVWDHTRQLEFKGRSAKK